MCFYFVKKYDQNSTDVQTITLVKTWSLQCLKHIYRKYKLLIFNTVIQYKIHLYVVVGIFFITGSNSDDF